MSYTPPPKILEKYAKVMVNFALGGGKGIDPGDTVYLQGPTSALPLYTFLQKRIIDSGGITIGGLYDDTSGTSRYFMDNATDEQLTRFLQKYSKGLVDDMDHRIAILSDYDVHELDGVDPKKMLMGQKSRKPLIKWLNDKENKGLYTWTLALYGTPSMAKEAGLSEQAYWEQIIKACYLDKKDPIANWKRLMVEANKTADKLSKIPVDKLNIRGTDADLTISLGKKRKWVTIDGRNIPSFEVFTSPDWRGTEGWIKFNQPLYNYGPKIEGIELHFAKGRVVKATAKKNEKLLLEMLKTDKGASQIGEFSLTDKRFSRITKFMANTLYDENIGGEFGNTHIAVGKAYLDTYSGDVSKLSEKTAKELGFNDSVVHNDMISISDRTVTATLSDGTKKIIYRNGQFTV